MNEYKNLEMEVAAFPPPERGIRFAVRWRRELIRRGHLEEEESLGDVWITAREYQDIIDQLQS